MKRKEPKQTNETTKKIIKLIIECVVVVGFVVILRNDRVEAAADNLILLEKRNPGYWEYLSEGVEIRSSGEIEGVPVDEVLSGNEIKELYSGEYNGITQSVEGNTLTFTGTATADSYPEIANISSLSTGTYFVSVMPIDGKPININPKFFIQTMNDFGWKGISYTTLAVANLGNCFYVEPEKYDAVQFLAFIPAGMSVENSYRPVLYKISDTDVTEDEITAYLGVDKESITADDWKIFNNRTKGTDYIISYTDGEITSSAGNVEIDSVGRIKE